MYMAPELYRGGTGGKTVDIYALGITLYKLLNSGRFPIMPPYPQPVTPDLREQALYRRLNGEIVPPPPGIDPALGAMVAKACAPDPGMRYQTAREFQDNLTRWRDAFRSRQTGQRPYQDTGTYGSGGGQPPKKKGNGSTGRIRKQRRRRRSRDTGNGKSTGETGGAVAAVDDQGILTAQGVGTAQITGQYNGTSAFFRFLSLCSSSAIVPSFNSISTALTRCSSSANMRTSNK